MALLSFESGVSDTWGSLTPYHPIVPSNPSVGPAGQAATATLSAASYGTGVHGLAANFSGNSVNRASSSFGTSFAVQADIPAAVNLTAGFTFTLWMLQPVGASTGAPLFLYGTLNGDLYYALLWVSGGSNPVIAFALSGPKVQNASASTGCASNMPITCSLIAPGKWTHVALSVGPRADDPVFRTRLYLNGTLASQSDATMPFSPSYFTVGAPDQSRMREGYAFQGLVDELKLYNYPLTAAQVAYDFLS